MAVSPSVMGNHSYNDTNTSSSSSSSSPASSFSSSRSYSSSDISQDESCSIDFNSSHIPYGHPPNTTNHCPHTLSTSVKNSVIKRPRMKRRLNDFVLVNKLTKLTNENEILRAKINMLTRRFGDLISQNDKQIKYDELVATERTTVFDILDQSSTTAKNHLTTSEQTSLDKLSMPIKRRLKSFAIKFDS